MWQAFESEQSLHIVMDYAEGGLLLHSAATSLGRWRFGLGDSRDLGFQRHASSPLGTAGGSTSSIGFGLHALKGSDSLRPEAWQYDALDAFRFRGRPTGALQASCPPGGFWLSGNF